MTKFNDYGDALTLFPVKSFGELSVCYILTLRLMIVFIFTPIFLLLTPLWWSVILYGIWFCLDYDSPYRGGYSEKWVKWWRAQKIHQDAKDYFPSFLHKTAELPLGKNYLIVSHPHGVNTFGIHSNFCTNMNNADQKFPGLIIRHATFGLQFWNALQRELLLLHGYISCDKKSLLYQLDTEKFRNNAVILVVGGLAEALDARPRVHILTLKNRKGFIRVALETGAQLVPQYSFGENELYDQVSNPPGSTLRSFQNAVRKYLKLPFPLYFGRGLFEGTFGLLPYRKQLDVVVGAPISVERIDNPTEEEVDALHKKYITALEQLFENNKAKFGVPSEQKLIIV